MYTHFEPAFSLATIYLKTYLYQLAIASQGTTLTLTGVEQRFIVSLDSEGGQVVFLLI